MKKEDIRSIIQQSILTKQLILEDGAMLARIAEAVDYCAEAFRSGGKVLFCGNGGSAADAQHLAAEFSGRFYLDRPPLFAEALHVNSSYLTAVANDYGYGEVFARIVRAKGRMGDVLFGISTSGHSPNVLKALEEARRIGMKTIGMTGATGGAMLPLCDLLFPVPSTDTPRIQEAHILIGHILCEGTESAMWD